MAVFKQHNEIVFFGSSSNRRCFFSYVRAVYPAHPSTSSTLCKFGCHRHSTRDTGYSHNAASGDRVTHTWTNAVGGSFWPTTWTRPVDSRGAYGLVQVGIDDLTIVSDTFARVA
uniref:Uncharacterized protein n=1 Tax=Schizaphis graminum TaxID=13262 RepID=A0A2S2PIA2_SCHGA